MPERFIKIGRSGIAGPLAKHWAIKVGDVWFELEGTSKSDKRGPNRIKRSTGHAAESGAGSWGGEVAGHTEKTDSEIDAFLDVWLANNPKYDFMLDNCQKFVYEFGFFLTGGVNFRLPHRMDAARTVGNSNSNGYDAYATSQDGINIIRIGTFDNRATLGYFNFRMAGPSAELSAIEGRGFHKGAWVDASVMRMETSIGNLVGAHIEPNLNTGLGFRDGNFDAHFLGFGTKIGADGVEVNTPLGGVNACLIM